MHERGIMFLITKCQDLCLFFLKKKKKAHDFKGLHTFPLCKGNDTVRFVVCFDIMSL